MKVLYISNKGETGGAARSQMAMIEVLRNDYGVYPIVLTYQKGILSNLCDKLGIENYSLGYEPFMIGGGSTRVRRLTKRILTPLYMIRREVKNSKALRAVENLVDMSNVNLIHTNTNRDDFGEIIARKYNIPHIWHIREFGDKDYDCIFLRSHSIRYMNESNGYFIAISDAVKNAWIDKGLDSSRIIRVYNGIDICQFDSSAERSFNKEKMNFIFTGTVYENKGQIQAIKAYEKLPETIKKHIFIDFYGGGAKEYINQLKKMCDAHNISDNIRFCGFSNMLNEILPKYDAALVCSKAEGFGRVTVEHMLSGLIVIASNAGANPELILDGVEGFLYKSEDIYSLCECMEYVYTNRTQLKKVTTAAQNKVITHFTKEINAQNVYNVYKKVSVSYE